MLGFYQSIKLRLTSVQRSQNSCIPDEMHSIFRHAPRRAAPMLRQRNICRPFSIAAPLRLKEDADRKPEDIEKAKQEQLKKQEEGKGEWHEELASSGEASVKHDKHDVEDHEEHMEDLQKQTAGKSEEEHPHGKSS